VLKHPTGWPLLHARRISLINLRRDRQSKQIVFAIHDQIIDHRTFSVTRLRFWKQTTVWLPPAPSPKGASWYRGTMSFRKDVVGCDILCADNMWSDVLFVGKFFYLMF